MRAVKNAQPSRRTEAVHEKQAEDEKRQVNSYKSLEASDKSLANAASS
jgi:hypothetical protein